MIFSENRFPLCADAALRVRIMLYGSVSGSHHPSGLLPTWKITGANSGKPEFGVRDRNLAQLPDASSPCPLVAHAQEFHRPVGYGDPEHRADGPLHQVNLAAMGADQFGGDRKPEPAAARPA